MSERSRRVLGLKGKYELWFEFLRLLKTEMKGEYDFNDEAYKRWGKVGTFKSFDAWWQKIGKTLQNSKVRIVTKDAPLRALPSETRIYIEVPLDRSPTQLTKSVGYLIKKRFNEVYKDRLFKKSKTLVAGFTDGRDIRVKVFKDLLLLHRAVLSKQKGLKGVKLLKACNDYQLTLLKKGRRRKLLSKDFVTVGRQELSEAEWLNYRHRTVNSVLRNLNRAVQRRDTVFRAVAQGEFPGSA
jgi:hypothetical protein